MNTEELYYQVASAHQLDQDDRNRQLELKASGTLGVAVALMGIGAVILTDFSTADVPTAAWLFALGLGLAFLAVAIAAFDVLWPRTFSRAPNLEQFSKHIEEGSFEESTMVEWIGDQFSANINSNEPIIIAKAKALNLAMLILVVQAGMLAALAAALRL